MHRIPVEDYAATIRELLAPLRDRPVEFVPIALAADRVTAVEVRSPIDLPTFRNSQMDGFAVHAADLAAIPAVLPVLGEIAAGAIDPAPLPAGAAVAIMTGAPVPPGADAVVPIEDTRRVEGGVEILRARARRRLRARSRVGPSRRAPSCCPPGCGSRHGIWRRWPPRTSGTSPCALACGSPWSARATNSFLRERRSLTAASPTRTASPSPRGLRRRCRRGRRSQLTGDDAARLASTFDRAIASGAELIVTSGGISMGAHEPVRQLLEPLGATVGTVDMQPGGPQAHARYRDVPVVCFPGNPVSSQLSFALFLAPLLREIAGLPPVTRTRTAARRSVDVDPGAAAVPARSTHRRRRCRDRGRTGLAPGRRAGRRGCADRRARRGHGAPGRRPGRYR